MLWTNSVTSVDVLIHFRSRIGSIFLFQSVWLQKMNLARSRRKKIWTRGKIMSETCLQQGPMDHLRFPTETEVYLSVCYSVLQEVRRVVKSMID